MNDSLPKTQEEADKLYRELDFLMCDEVIYRDGEATYEEARKSFNQSLLQATKIYSRTGFKPPDGDVFLGGKLPLPMAKKAPQWGAKQGLKSISN